MWTSTRSICVPWSKRWALKFDKQSDMKEDATGQPLLRADADDLSRINAEVAEITDIQCQLRDRHPDLKCLDRAAHQYQVAGGKVLLRVSTELPEGFSGVGLFVPGSEHIGVGRLSTGLGTPHIETNPDFLGLRASFLAASGQRVDFLALNNPTSPSDNHRDVMHVLHGTADAASARQPVPSYLAAGQARMNATLVKRMGPVKAEEIMAHIAEQSARTTRSSTAYQSYWTGVVEVNRTLGKFTLTPLSAENYERFPYPGERHLTQDWGKRQASRDITFRVYWISYLDERRTSLERLTQPWLETHKRFVGQLVFPRTDARSDDARLWAALAGEMGANPGNWISNGCDSPREPSTEFGLARKFAYERSARGRNALPLDAFKSALETGRIDDELAEELMRRMEQKRRLGHVDRAPLRFFVGV
jgi:hypothetical protein